MSNARFTIPMFPRGVLRTSIILYTLILTSSAVSSQFELSSPGCTDPSGFDSCFSQATNLATQCYSKACQSGSGQCLGPDNCVSSDQNCVSACVCTAYQSWINCALSHCWNRAYSCEYQYLVISAFQACDYALNVLYPPYFPAPANTPGTCSCQIGQLFISIHNSVPQYQVCEAASKTSQQDNQCACCGASHALSALPDICPGTNGTTLPFYSPASMSALSGAVETLQNKCPASASEFNCTAAPLDFSLVNNGVFYGSGDLPPVGSLLVSDTPGTLTVPLSSTLVWSLFGGGVPATAVAVTGGSAVPASSSVGAASGSTSTSSTASGSATGSTIKSEGSKSTQWSAEWVKFVPGLCVVLLFGLYLI